MKRERDQLDRVAKVNPSTDQCMDKSGDHVRGEQVTDGAYFSLILKNSQGAVSVVNHQNTKIYSSISD